jgi:predicted nucleic acid-binding protein
LPNCGTGSLKAGWGAGPTARLEAFFRSQTVVMPDNDLVAVCAQLRNACRQSGHALHEKQHDADRWIAATAVRHRLTLITSDRIFVDVPGLTVNLVPAA